MHSSAAPQNRSSGHGGLPRLIEGAAAVLIVALALVHLGQMTGAMAASSLSTDEFGTIGTFSAKGPLRVMSSYRAAKNHVFFNLINSLFPGRESLHPMRARIFSFIATWLTAGLLIAYGVWRGRWIESAIIVGLWIFAPQAIDLGLLARGYGFLNFFAVVSTLSIIEWFRTGDVRWYAAAAGATVLGTYTVPSYIFFGGPLLLAGWLAARQRVVLLICVSSVLLILLLYAPLLGGVLKAAKSYEGLDEVDFAQVHGVVRAMKLYLLSCDDWEMFGLFTGSIAVVFLARGPASRGYQAAMVAVLSFFLACLILRTAPIRVSAFATLPFALCAALAAGEFVRQTRSRLPTPIASAMLGIWFAVHGSATITNFAYIPTEDWIRAANAVDLMFSPSTEIDPGKSGKYIFRYLDASAGWKEGKYSPERFDQQTVIVIDAANKWAEGRQFHAAKASASGAEVVIPGTIRDIAINFVLPQQHASSIPPALCDRNASTGISTATPIDLPVPPSARRFALLFDRNAGKVRVTAGARRLEARVFGNLVIVDLPSGLDQSSIRVELAAPRAGVHVVEVWEPNHS